MNKEIHNKMQKDAERDLKIIKKLQQENKQLKDNWNELKKWLAECLKEKNKSRLYDNNSYEAGIIDTYENVQDKMQELEKGKSE